MLGLCACVVCPWWLPAGSVGWLDVTSGWQVGDVELGYCRTVVLGRRGYYVRAKLSLRRRLAGHAELAAGVEPATC